MRAVAIKKGQIREKAAGLQEMGTLRCDGCGEEFFIHHHPASADKSVAETRKQSGLKKFLPKNTSQGNTPIGSNCQTDPGCLTS